MNDFAGQTSYTLSDVEMYLWVDSSMEGSACFELLARTGDQPIGVLSYLIPGEQADRAPRLGSLLLHAGMQRQGLGSEALGAVETGLLAAGWTRLLASPLVALPSAQAFLAANGFQLPRRAA
jgi:GNAT superfamily N-acetyltransferase